MQNQSSHNNRINAEVLPHPGYSTRYVPLYGTMFSSSRFTPPLSLNSRHISAWPGQ